MKPILIINLTIGKTICMWPSESDFKEANI